MDINLTQRDIELLQLTPQQVSTLTLTSNLILDTPKNCRDANQIIVDAYRIISEKLAVLKGDVGAIKHLMITAEAEALGKLTTCKLLGKQAAAITKKNKAAEAAWLKAGGAIEEFKPIATPKLPDISHITSVNASDLTDQGVKSIAKEYSIRTLRADYAREIRLMTILDSLKDSFIKIGDRINTTTMSFGIENKIAGA